MRAVQFSDEYQLEKLERSHSRRTFDCGNETVNDWLQTKALQNQEKHLSTTKVLRLLEHKIAGFYTLALGQVDLSELPADIARKLPRRALPVAIIAWLGVSVHLRSQGLGRRLFSQALLECYEAGKTFAFIAILIDCLDANAKAFYQQWEFEELPGYPFRLFLSYQHLEKIIHHDE